MPHPRVPPAILLLLATASCGQLADDTRTSSSIRRDAAPPAVALGVRPTTRPDVFEPGDLLLVRVDELTTDPGAALIVPTRVQADGTIEPPLCPSMVVTGMDRATVERTLSAAYMGCFSERDPTAEVTRLQVANTGGPMPGPIAEGDLIRCEVNGLTVDPGRTRVLVQRVDGAGRVSLPMLAPVRVAGLTDGPAARAVAEAYRRANVLAGAQVSVLVLERAPADAGHLALPDGPLKPVPEALRFLYERR